MTRRDCRQLFLEIRNLTLFMQTRRVHNSQPNCELARCRRAGGGIARSSHRASNWSASEGKREAVKPVGEGFSRFREWEREKEMCPIMLQPYARRHWHLSRGRCVQKKARPGCQPWRRGRRYTDTDTDTTAGRERHENTSPPPSPTPSYYSCSPLPPLLLVLLLCTKTSACSAF